MMSEAAAPDQTGVLRRKAIKTGRRLVLAVIAYTMSVVIIDNAPPFEADPGLLFDTDLGYAVFNTLWFAFLCICLYRRANWARWILSILIVLDSLVLAYFSFPYFSVRDVSELVGGMLVPIVLFSPAVGAYFRAGGEDFGKMVRERMPDPDNGMSPGEKLKDGGITDDDIPF
jgi:hypothetical protein